MVYDGEIEGKYVTLRSVSEDDAEFTSFVRKDAKLTRYLPRVDNTIEEQKAWIRKQRQDETDYFFVATDKDGIPVGTIGIYNIKDGCAEGGRLTSMGNALQSIEIQLLALHFDFDILNLNKVTTVVFKGNERALKLSKLFGIEFEDPCFDERGNKVYNGSVTKESFKNNENKIKSMIYR